MYFNRIIERKHRFKVYALHWYFVTFKGVNMKITHLFVFVALTLGLGTLAYAKHGEDDGDHHDRHHQLADVDTNKDGAVSREEFMAHHQKMADNMFTKLDANKDGKVDETERKAGKEKMGMHCDRKGHDEHHDLYHK